MTKKYFEGSDWTIQDIHDMCDTVEDIANNDFDMNLYPNQIEIISADQMLEAYSSVAMPVMYDHWSYGKSYIQNKRQYDGGQMGLAYEVVINTDPCLVYLMENNTALMQLLVLAHAGCGHNHFFKNNYLFKQWTDAGSILTYLTFAKKYIREAEEKYGNEAVEEILDSCHSLMNYGVDAYKRPPTISAEEEASRIRERNDFVQQHLNELWSTIPNFADDHKVSRPSKFPTEPQENILYFIEKNSPTLAPWQREVVRIVRKVAQYFYPQRQTQVMNEGLASWTHYSIIQLLREKGMVSQGYMLEMFDNHAGVIYQPTYQQSAQINPYALGFGMYKDIERICRNPTQEDKEWFPDFAGNPNFNEVRNWACVNFKDDSFIHQFLSPKLIRDMKMFTLQDNCEEDKYEVMSIHNKSGYQHVRETLANQYDISLTSPNVQIEEVNVKGDRSLLLKHAMNQTNQMLDENTAIEVIKHVKRLWGFDVSLYECVDGLPVNSYSTGGSYDLS